MEIFKLFGSIFIHDEDAQKKIDGIDNKANKTGGTLGSMIGTAAKWGAGIATAAGVAAGGLFALVTQTSEAASAINDMSSRTGLSTETLQELKFATGQVGVNFDSITGAVGRLTRTMSGAEEGGEKAQAAFDKLGIATSGADGNMRSMDSMFPEVINKLAGMTNETERNALAMDLFGKGAMELVPLLAQGGDGINQLTQQAHDLGLVMSDEAIAAGDQFGDSWDSITASLGTVVAKISVELMPTFQAMMDWVIAHMPQIQATVKVVFDAIGTAISFTIEWVGKLIDWFKSMRSDGESQFSGIFESAKTYFSALIDAVKAFIEMFQEFWSKYGDEITVVFKAVWDLVVSIFKTTVAIVTDIFKIFAALFRGDWGALWNAVKSLFSNIWNGIGDILKKALALVVAQAKFYLAMFKDTFEGIFGGIKTFIINIFDGIVSKITSTIQLIRDKIQSVLDFFNNVKDTVSGFVSGAKDKIGGFVSAVVPGLATGGEVQERGTVLVGEKGPELLSLPKGARVTPLDHPAAAGGITIQINNPTLFNDRDADRLGELVVVRLRTLGVVPG